MIEEKGKNKTEKIFLQNASEKTIYLEGSRLIFSDRYILKNTKSSFEN